MVGCSTMQKCYSPTPDHKSLFPVLPYVKAKRLCFAFLVRWNPLSSSISTFLQRLLAQVLHIHLNFSRATPKPLDTTAFANLVKCSLQNQISCCQSLSQIHMPLQSIQKAYCISLQARRPYYKHAGPVSDGSARCVISWLWDCGDGRSPLCKTAFQ